MTGLQTGIIGIETLLGREMKDVVEGRKSLSALLPYSAGDEIPSGKQESDADEVAHEPLNARSLSGLSSMVLAGSPVAAAQVYDWAKAAGGRPMLVDCQGQLEIRPEARIFAPVVSEPGEADTRDTWLFVVAHPVASALTLVLTRLARYRKLKGTVVNVFEPASERGKPGVSELSQQTTALLTFKKLDKTVFDTQVSFNLLPRIGEDATVPLLSTEARIDRHLATLLSRQSDPVAIPMPSIRVLQAPVFHGYSVSLWVEFESEVQAQAVEETLASAQIEIRGAEEEPPDNVGAVSQSGLLAGDIRVDRNNARAVWIWIAMDNLRMVADAAADLLRVIPPRQPMPLPAGKRKP